MEQTDFPARYFSCWGLLGLGQLAVCRISKGWSAGAELCEVCQALGWCRCLCCFLWNQPVGVGAALPGANPCVPSPAKDQRPALPLAPAGRQEDAAIKWGRALLGRCLLWALMLLQGGLGARIAGKQFPHIHGEQ